MSKEGKVKSPTRGVSIKYCIVFASIRKRLLLGNKKGEQGGHDEHFNRLCEEHVFYE